MFHAKSYIIQTIVSGVLKAYYIVVVWIYINISGTCKNSTANHLGQQLFGLALIINVGSCL